MGWMSATDGGHVGRRLGPLMLCFARAVAMSSHPGESLARKQHIFVQFRGD
jgi:hypothetical protein